MISLIEIFKILRKGNTPKEIDWKNIFSSVWHKSEKLPIEQILGLAEEIARVSTNFKGYHTNEVALKAAYPKADNKKDFFAWVGSKPTLVWKVFANGADWENTGDEPTEQEIDLAEYAKKETIYNISQNFENYNFKNKKEARLKVPVNDRSKTQCIIYRLANGEIILELFKGDNIENWLLDSSWSQLNDSAGYFNPTYKNDEFFLTSKEARDSIPQDIRNSGMVLAYSTVVKKSTPNHVDNYSVLKNHTMKSNGTLTTGQPGDSENVVIVCNIPLGYDKVSFRTTVSNYGTGGAFFDLSDKFISGFAFPPSSHSHGDIVEILLPSNASTIKTTYKNDTVVHNSGLHPFDGFDFYEFQENSTPNIDIFTSSEVSNETWGEESNWESVVLKSDIKQSLMLDTKKATYKNVTEELIATKQEHRSINEAGGIVIDGSREIGIIGRYYINEGDTLRLYIPFPSDFGNQPAIHIYAAVSPSGNKRIDYIFRNENGRYVIQNNYGQRINIIFYYQITQSSAMADFNILSEIEAYLSKPSGSVVKTKSGDVVIENTDSLLYYQDELAMKDLSSDMLRKLAKDKTITPSGTIVTGIDESIVMYELKANCRYYLGGFTNTWGDDTPFAHLHSKDALETSVSAIKLTRSMLIDGAFNIMTNSTDTKLSLCIKYEGDKYPRFDSTDSIYLIEESVLGKHIVSAAGEVISVTGASSGSLSLESTLRLAMPTSMINMNIKIGKLPAFKGDKKPCVIEVDFMNGINFTKNAEIDVQGATTANDPTYLQKNYTITFFNHDDSKCDIKIGDFPFDDKHQMKAWWTDSSQARDITLGKIINDYDLSKPYGQQFPFSTYYKGAETGAKCISLGFPFQMTVNGSWHGLYSWILRFQNGNWNINKKNPDHILMKSGSSDKPMQEETIQVNDEYWDFKTELNDETRVKVMRLFDFLRTSNSATYKAELHNYMDIDSVLEYFIWVDAFQLVDNFWGNIVLVTYDSVIWYARIRDMDRSIGIGFSDEYFLDPHNPLSNEEKYSKSIWFPKLWSAFKDELKVKYQDMRNKVLNLEHFAKRFVEHENLIGDDLLEKSLERWPTRPGNTEGYETNANQIIEYYRERLVYLDAKYGHVE